VNRCHNLDGRDNVREKFSASVGAVDASFAPCKIKNGISKWVPCVRASYRVIPGSTFRGLTDGWIIGSKKAVYDCDDNADQGDIRVDLERP
jgi:hypothetical protein